MKTRLLILVTILLSALLASCSVNNGTLQGTVTLNGVAASNLTAGFFDNRSIEIVKAGEENVFKTVTIQQDGTYSINLPSGNYIVRIPEGSDLPATGMPTSIKIDTGKTTTLDIDYDNGIR